MIQIRDDLINIPNQDQFELRTFRSNERSVLPEQPDWIHTSANSLKMIVGNRISEVTTLTKPNGWRHINSENNAADIVSRGAHPSEIIQNPIWFNGSEFLKSPENQWPQSHLNINCDDVPEKKDPIIVCNAVRISATL
ncbi:hypothetical protein Zmor_028307 [Zophobas morio]|uniref:Uncharacterized protein n=1 Tax=Zophobas morio TaxID=2755281 RepID=A0AA38HVB8_9CUCU|nr:hypothetical protein Zmor_028307 [Zophobas morio]